MYDGHLTEEDVILPSTRLGEWGPMSPALSRLSGRHKF